MKNKRLFVSLFFLFFLLGPVCGYAVSLSDLLADPQTYNNKSIVVNGEAIGEALKDKGGAWVNISSDGTSFGVFFAEAKAVEDIDYWGSYKETGDWLRITGTFNENCPLHQISDIHVDKLSIVKRGKLRKLSVLASKVKIALISFGVFLILAVIYFIKSRFSKDAK